MIEGRAAIAASGAVALCSALLVGLVLAEGPAVPSVSPELLPVTEPGLLSSPGPSAEATRDAPGEPDPGPEADTPPDAREASEAGASWEPAHTETYEVEVAGQTAEGLVGVPAGEPTTLVLLAHPWGMRAGQFGDHLQALAERGVLAVAMDFRGPGDAYKVQAGAEDTIAAALDLQARHPTVDRTLVFGHSMGGQVALLAAATAPPGTFDYVFVGAGVTDLEALWNSNLPMRPSIEHETGGTPMEVPDAYAGRSPIDRVADVATQGLARVFLVYGSGDPAVPVDHAEKMYDALAAAGVPVSYYVVTTDEDPFWCVPALQVCPDTTPASHWAGRFELMQPFIDHRIERLLDPEETALRGTYDGDAGTYEPSDVGDG